MSTPIDLQLAHEADELATRLNRCGLRRIDPEEWHVERDDIAKRLRRMARKLRGEPERPAPTTTWRPNGRPCAGAAAPRAR